MDPLYDLKYPIGEYEPPAIITDEILKSYINEIRLLPTLIELEVQQLDAHQLDTPYRPEGWTVAQVVHHVPDSHLNAYTRFKLALTEEAPRIRPYNEGAWALLPDVSNTPVNVSLTLLHALHTRWTNLLESLTDEQWARTYVHPEHQRSFDLRTAAGMYAWHGKHHLAHITRLKDRNNWY